MAACIRTSRFLIVALLLFLTLAELSANWSESVAAASVAPSPGRPADVTSRGGSRSDSGPMPGHDTLAVRRQIPLASPTSIPPTTVPTRQPTTTAEPRSNYLGLFTVSGYSDSARNGSNGLGITKSGERTRWGVVAVDPRVIPLGSRLLIGGLEGTVFTALDTGSGVLGRWIDVWYPTDWDAIQHGLQTREVHLLVR